MKANVDTAIASLLLLVTIVFLVQRQLGYLAVWLVLITVVVGYGVRMPLVAAVTLGIATVAGVVLISGQALKENYENPSESDEKKEEKKQTKEAETKSDPEPHSTSKSSKIEDSHLDAGTTVLHAFQKLNPEQVLQMRDDTKELMETQKQLVETLSSLGPQVQQGAELIKSFQGMFGGNLTEVLKQ